MPSEKSEKIDPRQFSEIYNAFVAASKLTDEDRGWLKIKRGFSDETIDAIKVRSCSPDNIAAINALQFKYGIDNARSSGLWFGQGPNRKLTDSGNVIIPYLEGSDVVSLRPHKDALKGLTLPFYLPFGRPLKPGLCILAESEFKAVAAAQLGYQAIGIAGIAAAARTHYKALVELLKTSGATSLCVMFDNEEKGNPQFPNFKKHFWDRYDTQFFAYYMAEKLAYDGIDSSVAVLPDRWMIDGKIDIDGALAAGKTREDFRMVIDERRSPDDYLKTLPADVQILVRRRWEKMFIQIPVRIERNCYVVPRGDPAVDTPISNFVFSIDNNVYSADGDCRREVTIKSRIGDVYRKQTLEGKHLAHLPPFQARTASIGPLQFTGTQKELEMVVAFESAREIGKRTVQPDHCGWNEAAGMFLFENGGVSSKGERLLADDDSIVWSGLTGWQAIQLAQGSADKSSGLPVLAPEDMDPGMLIDMIASNFGDDMEIRMACAWSVACLVSQWVVPKCGGAFPILFVQGQARAGKSTLAKWLCAMAGLKTDGFSYPAGTLVGAQRGLAFYSSLPFWMDEYRNSTKHTDKEGMLRSAYDGQGALKGLRSGFGVRANVIRGRVILSGQDTPIDVALQQRCITVRVKENNRSSQDIYNQLNALMPSMSGVIPVIVRRFYERQQNVFEAISTARSAFRRAGLDDRTAITYAILVGVYDAIVREDHAEFLAYVMKHAKESFAIKSDEKPPYLFLDGIATLMSRGQLNGNAVRAVSGLLAIDVAPAYQAWREAIRRTGDDFNFKQVTVVNEFEEIDGFVERERMVKFGSANRKCLILDPRKDERVRMIYDRVSVDEGS